MAGLCDGRRGGDMKAVEGAVGYEVLLWRRGVGRLMGKPRPYTTKILEGGVFGAMELFVDNRAGFSSVLVVFEGEGVGRCSVGFWAGMGWILVSYGLGGWVWWGESELIWLVSACPTCGGNGEVISEICRRCGGGGRVRGKKDIKVKIPPGVSKGSILRVAGEGDAGPKGGPPGDLFVCLEVKEIPEIQRDGINLLSAISISYTDAILGTIVKVKTVEGTVDFEVPPGTQPGDVLVLAKKGVPKLNKPSIRGDHLFTVKVTIPKRISTQERELLVELASLGTTKSARTRTRPQPGQGEMVDTPATSTETEGNKDSEDQDDPWKKLKDFAGSGDRWNCCTAVLNHSCPEYGANEQFQQLTNTVDMEYLIAATNKAEYSTVNIEEVVFDAEDIEVLVLMMEYQNVVAVSLPIKFPTLAAISFV
ncbi:hypothetical protein KSS87_003063, partial [Heliosperma pusillum]